MGLGDINLSQEVSRDEYLELTNGVVVSSALELLEALKIMDEETFFHHVSSHNNDFSEWILENYHNGPLSRKVWVARKKNKIIKILESALKKELRKFTRGVKGGGSTKINSPKKRKEILEIIGENG